MRITGNKVVISGGSSGIGLAIAKALLRSDNEVVVCGRSEDRLLAASAAEPALRTVACDISARSERERLMRWTVENFPQVNVLVNNAGIQRETDFLTGAPELTDGESEIDTNLTAAIHLSALFIPHFLRRGGEGAIINVTSGLAFVPLMSVPVYCATKAGLHSFSMSLRSQLQNTGVQVFELIPPILKTGLHRDARSRQQSDKRGIAPERVAERLLEGMSRNQFEIGVGQGRDLKIAARVAPHLFHRLLNHLVKE